MFAACLNGEACCSSSPCGRGRADGEIKVMQIPDFVQQALEQLQDQDAVERITKLANAPEYSDARC